MRDPRTDPQAGDALTKCVGRYLHRVERRVIDRHGGDIRYVTHRGTVGDCWITTWQQWARGAQVIQP